MAPTSHGPAPESLESTGSRAEHKSRKNVTTGGPGKQPFFDQAAALAFLDALGGGPFCFRTFDDNKDRSDPRLVTTPTGALEQCGGRLASLNAKGAGVYVVVNQGGNTDKEINTIRALFADFDQVDKNRRFDFSLKPSLVIESSPGKHHVYWLVDDFPVEQFRAAQKRIIGAYGSDPTVKNESRVMRVPGFYHRKDPIPFLSRIIHNTGRRYDRATIAEWLDTLPDTNVPPLKNTQDQLQVKLEKPDPYAEKAFQNALGAVMTAPGGSRNDELNRQAHGLYGLALVGRLDEQEVTRQLERAGSAAGLSGNEIAATLSSARRAAEPRPDKSQESQESQSQPWRDPKPLNVAEEPEPYPISALNGDIGAAVNEVCEFVQCPEALAACSALATASAVCQALADVERATKLVGPSSLYFLLSADSGERKSTADGYFSRGVGKWVAERREELKPEFAKYEADRQAWEAERAGVIAAIRDAAKKGEAIDKLKARLAVIEARKPPRPLVPNLLYSDATPESVAYDLATGWPSAALLSAEGGVVLGGHAMGADSLMRNLALLNALWSGERHQVNRRTSESFSLESARLTIGLAAQPAVIQDFVDKTRGLARGSGFMARFLFASPASTQGGRFFREPPKSWPALARFQRRLRELLEIPLNFDEHGQLAPPALRMTAEARQIWVSFHDATEQSLRDDLADCRDIASKSADNAARLACLLHVFEHGPTGMIDAQSIIAGCRLAGWHLYEARRYIRTVAIPPEAKEAAKLEAWIIAQSLYKYPLQTNDVLKNGPSSLRKKEAMENTMKLLAERHRARIVEQGRKRFIEINPQLLEVER
ncbi:DUF3987 domain-containing protein [Desulfurivibrio sp. C05AmB]|uniref:DUF3987 domain-containing protein n=1 Tax=Desulfurivibrio sp. C05AmB TaxID=3374371 RepID=UPI00376EFD6B